MKHYLVTGGCGFIGSHLVHTLVQKGHKVTILDDLSSGHLANCSPKSSLIQGTILNKPLLESLMDTVDGCFHLAAITSVQVCNEDWELAHAINATGTLHVFSAAQKRRVPIIYASSAAVYGPQQDFPISEEAPAYPISSYACDKYYCELLGRIAKILFDVPNIGIRFFNVYGPHQDPLSPYSSVISNFIYRATHNQDLVIHGNGYQVRDFLYIDDAISVLLAAMDNLQGDIREEILIPYESLTNPLRIPYHVINACTGKETAIKDLANYVVSLTGSKAQCIYLESRKTDIYESVGDPSLLKEILGVSANTSIINGLKQTIAWMKEAASH